MASKKGIGVTIAILVGVVAASFLVYLIPENNDMKLVVSDFEKQLDDIDERTLMLSMGIEKSFDDLINHKLSPEEYFITAGVTQSQVNSLIIELTLSGAPQEWTASYKTYTDALKILNEQIRESVVVANLMKDNDNSDYVNEIISKIHELRAELLTLIEKSNNLRP
uniref:Uncharacterized protein n=1 Tax=uncultured marine thaumarchaeote AD1000_33_B07 TaxID=1455908 RepID=A0A075FUT3_9ARCH|nr:hypothetical protein [uncultured marine thaumarchaeote AD1000_33_B07]